MNTTKPRRLSATLCATALVCLSSHAFAQAAPAFAPAAPAVGGDARAVVADAKHPSDRQGRLFFVPKIGIGLGGEAEREETETCSASYSGCDAPKSDSYEDSSGLMFGGDVLFGVSKSLRLGVGAAYVPSRTAEGGDIVVGSDLSAYAVGELVLEASPTLALAFRAQLGGVMLFPGGELQDDIDEERRACTSGQSGVCEVGEGPFPGYTWALGAGVIAPVGNTSLRVDVLYQAYSIDRLREKEDHGAAGSKEEREKIGGHTLWLTAGIEI